LAAPDGAGVDPAISVAANSTMATAFIYVLIDPRTGEVRYVGKSNDPIRRLQGHLQSARADKPWGVCRWIRDLAAVGLTPGVVVIDQVSADEWEPAEVEWIAHFRSAGARLTNTAPGGLGGFSPEAIEKAHAAKRGVAASLETRAKMSAAKLGVKKSPEHVEAVRKALTGRANGPLSAETKAKISASLTGRRRSPETRTRMSAARRGERCYNARLTEHDVLAIRAAVASGTPRKEMSTRYGVSYTTVVDIVLKRRWAHL
jgi:hypothetical protein